MSNFEGVGVQILKGWGSNFEGVNFYKLEVIDEVQNAKRKAQNAETALLIIILVHEVNISHACIYRTRQRISQIRKDLYRCKIENFAIPTNYNSPNNLCAYYNIAKQKNYVIIYITISERDYVWLLKKFVK